VFKRLIEYFLRKAIDWFFRVRSNERFLLSSGFSTLIVVFGGPRLLETILLASLDRVPEGFSRARETLDAFDGWIFMICATVIVAALVSIVVDSFLNAKDRSKKRVIVIEARGLRDDDGSPLHKIPFGKAKGQVIPILLDLRNRLDGKVIKPERALEEISAVHRSVLQYQKGMDRTDMTTIYGGLTSVPYTFLTGVLLDDEGEIITYDWDRTLEAWRSLDGEDDGLAFQLSGIDEISSATEVVIALAFSYPVNDEDLESTFPYPVVRLSLNGMSSDAHWSQSKQNRLAQQFLEAVKHLSALGVQRIHLVMAAPNSAVFSFGRRYDKRNLPELVVYQFERGRDQAYPWGLIMPVAGIEQTEVLYRDGSDCQ